LEETRRWTPGWIIFAVILCLVAIPASIAGYRVLTAQAHAVDAGDFVDSDQMAIAPPPPVTRPGGSAGTWRIDCGRNEEGMHNADNVVASPGQPGGAHHVHDYVGNLSTNALSTDESLAAAGTTCLDGDRSTYFWPVLRVLGAGDEADGNHGTILVPDSVLVEYQGSPLSNVVAMPRFLRASTGDAHGFSSGGANTEHVQWTCSGSRGRVARQYPRCPSGQQVVRVFDFPSCWNGRATDSANHRSQIVFPDATGACPAATFPVPRLHLEIAYTVSSGADYAIDSFPEEHRSPISDHADYIDVMPDALMANAVDCINSGRHCTA
jgi:uncharacterized protein DUF1996